MSSGLRAFLFSVGFPTLVALVYFGFIASDVFVSETRFAIRTSDENPASGLLSTMLGGGASGIPGDDSFIVRDYILSRDMLSQLESRLGLRQHYSSDAVDAFSRLDLEASEEDFLAFYRDMVEVTSEGEITTLQIRAFEAEKAQDIGKEIIALSEDLVNRLSERIIEDTLRFARREVDLAETRVKESSSRVTKFRAERQSIAPGEETTAVLGIVTGLEAQLAEARAELAEVETFMRPDSPRVTSLKSRVDALDEQVRVERLRLASESGSDLTRLIDSYEPLVLDQRLAEQRYTSALTSLEVARAEAQRKQRYLVAFVTPELPDEALEPDRALKIGSVLLGALMIFGIGGLVVAAIKDHSGL